MNRILFITQLLFCVTFAQTIGLPSEFKDTPAESLPEFLWRRGFWRARVDSIRDGKIFAYAGTPTLIDSIVLEPEDEHIRFALQHVVQKGDTFNVHKLALAQEKIVSYFENTGYPFVACSITVKLEHCDSESCMVSLQFLVEKWDSVVLERFDAIIEGIATKKTVIEHAMLFSPPRIFTASEIEKGTQRILRTGFVQIITLPYPALDAAGVWTLATKVKVLPSTVFSGLLGYSEKNLAGDLSFSAKNLFGTGRKLSAAFFADENRRKYDFSFREPFVGKSNISPEISSKWDMRYNSFTKREHYIGAFYPLSYESDLYLGIGTTRSTSKNSVIIEHEAEIFFVKTNFNFCTLDDLLFPQTGVNFESGLTLERQFFWADSVSETKFGSQISCNFLYAKEIYVFNLWVKGGCNAFLSPKEVSEELWHEFGGFKTVRGYRENFVSAPRVSWINYEMRLDFAHKAFLFPFFDVGLYEMAHKAQFIYGYGLGFEYRYSLGAFSVAYALAKDRSMSNGLLHFGLRMDF